MHNLYAFFSDCRLKCNTIVDGRLNLGRNSADIDRLKDKTPFLNDLRMTSSMLPRRRCHDEECGGLSVENVHVPVSNDPFSGSSSYSRFHDIRWRWSDEFSSTP